MYQVSCFYHKMHNWSDFLHESALLLGLPFEVSIIVVFVDLDELGSEILATIKDDDEVLEFHAGAHSKTFPMHFTLVVHVEQTVWNWRS